MSSVYRIYTDGLCIPNPGFGTWAFIVTLNNESVHSDYGCDSMTTNNRMEYMAGIKAMQFMETNLDLAYIKSDSKLLVDTYNLWIDEWYKTGKILKKKNQDLLEDLFKLKQAVGKRVKFNWVPGHSGIYWNERVDELTNTAYKDASKNLI